jgi:predicted MFS family arabinose efflux permease
VLAARVAEGLAAGIVQPIPAIIILRAFEPSEQGRASGIFGMGVVLAPAIGPSIGGVLVDLFGWRSIFFMVVPFCLASLYMAYRFVPVHLARRRGRQPRRRAAGLARPAAGQRGHAVPAQRPGGAAWQQCACAPPCCWVARRRRWWRS